MFYPHSQPPHLQTYKEAMEIIRSGLLPSGLLKLLTAYPLGTTLYIHSFMSQGYHSLNHSCDEAIQWVGGTESLKGAAC